MFLPPFMVGIVSKTFDDCVFDDVRLLIIPVIPNHPLSDGFNCKESNVFDLDFTKLKKSLYVTTLILSQKFIY